MHVRDTEQYWKPKQANAEKDLDAKVHRIRQTCSNLLLNLLDTKRHGCQSAPGHVVVVVGGGGGGVGGVVVLVVTVAFLPRSYCFVTSSVPIASVSATTCAHFV